MPAKWRSKRTKAGALNPPVRPTSFGPVLKDIAERLGLRVVERRERVAQKHASLYKDIQSDTFSGHPEKVRVYGIDPASWREMMMILDRRADPPKPWESPTSVEDLTVEEAGVDYLDISPTNGRRQVGAIMAFLPAGAIMRDLSEGRRRIASG